MSDLSLLIKHFRQHYYSVMGTDPQTQKPTICDHYQGNDQCNNPQGCLCRKMAEIRGNIDYVIPQEYRDFTINNVRGIVKTQDGKEIKAWSDETAAAINQNLNKYLFGADADSATGRDSFNKASKMDRRYSEGANLIIHGKPPRKKTDKGMPTHPIPTGKTMIASLIMKEAIWRRLYSTNRADTYAMISYQTLRQDLRLKSDRAYSLKEFDWLVIDDISEPANDQDFNHQHFLTLFDDFLMTRMENRLPTILACDFDVLSKDYTDSLGYSFQKMVTSKNTWLIKVGD